MARSLVGAGASRKSMVHVAYGYGLFTGGLGVHYGAEKMGCICYTCILGEYSKTNHHTKGLQARHFVLHSFLCAVHSRRALYIRPHSEDINLKAGVFGAEPWSEEMRKEIEGKLGLKAVDIYGLSEIMGPAVSCECLEQRECTYRKTIS